MDKLNLIEFDEVELMRDDDAASPTSTAMSSAAPATAAAAAVEDDDDEALLIVDSHSPSPTPPPPQLPQTAGNASSLPPSSSAGPDDVIGDDDGADNVSDDFTLALPDPVVLPPVTDILPPSTARQIRQLPRLDADGQYPPPEVNTGEDEFVNRRFSRRMVLGLGVSQLIVGMVSVCLGSVSIALWVNFSIIGHGIWAGCTCMATGFVGLRAYRKVTFVRVIWYMVVSIVATGCTGAMFAIAVAGCLRKDTTGYYDGSSYFQFSASLGINLLMSIIAMLGMTLTITSWILTCRASWSGRWACDSCCCPFTRTTVATVQLSDAYYHRSEYDPSNVVCDFTERSQPPAYTPSIPPPAYAETLPANHSRQK